MPQVMKTQVAYIKKFARSWLKWKYPFVVVHLPTHYFPCFRRVFESSDLVSLGGMFEISDSTGLRAFIVIAEQEVGDFALSTCGVNRKPHNVFHRHV